MRLLLTNDDGIDAEGLAALAFAARALGKATVVAPLEPWSSRGHAVTTGTALRIFRQGDERFAIDGTPADCVRLGLFHLASDADWVVAGVNSGANLGADIYHSGTVAAAREAVLHGKPGVAVSHYLIRGRPLDWDRAAEWTLRVLRQVLDRPWSPGILWNINLPHLEPGDADPEIVDCLLDPSPLPLSFEIRGDEARYNGSYAQRQRLAGRDVDTCFSGRISVTRIALFA